MTRRFFETLHRAEHLAEQPNLEPDLVALVGERLKEDAAHHADGPIVRILLQSLQEGDGTLGASLSGLQEIPAKLLLLFL